MFAAAVLFFVARGRGFYGKYDYFCSTIHKTTKKRHYNMRKLINIALAVLLVAAMAACTGRGAKLTADDGTPDTTITHAKLLKISHADGYTVVEVENPWKPGTLLHRYVLVPSGWKLPGNLPQGTVVRTPVKCALVYSEVHTSALKDLGAFGAVKGVTDAQYFTDPDVISGIKSGSIADCGPSTTPSVERVMELKPGAILLSPFQGTNYGHIAKTDIPLIECADYMEATPLGRAEWIKLLGELTGRRREADSIFNSVAAAYEDCRKAVAASKEPRPTVLTETVTSGVWYVPGGQSYMARILADAGASYPWAGDKSAGSLSLDFGQVLAKAQNADFWLIKTFDIHSYADLQKQYALNANFKAFKQHKVMVCDTGNNRFYQEFPFHPDRLLRDLASIFHPNLGITSDAGYFKPLAQ